MVVEQCEWRPHVSIARRLNPKAKVDVIKGDREVPGVEPTDIFEQRFTQYQTSACNGGHIRRQREPLKISQVRHRLMCEHMSGDAHHAQNDPGMLHGIV